MKTLQKQVGIVWRFRCDRCRSKFEMTDEERLDNDWKYNESTVYKDRNEPGALPHNPLNKFDCPVCGKQRYIQRNDLHRFIVFDDGTELKDF